MADPGNDGLLTADRTKLRMEVVNGCRAGPFYLGMTLTAALAVLRSILRVVGPLQISALDIGILVTVTKQRLNLLFDARLQRLEDIEWEHGAPNLVWYNAPVYRCPDRNSNRRMNGAFDVHRSEFVFRERGVKYVFAVPVHAVDDFLFDPWKVPADDPQRLGIFRDPDADFDSGNIHVPDQSLGLAPAVIVVHTNGVVFSGSVAGGYAVGSGAGSGRERRLVAGEAGGSDGGGGGGGTGDGEGAMLILGDSQQDVLALLGAPDARIPDTSIGLVSLAYKGLGVDVVLEAAGATVTAIKLHANVVGTRDFGAYHKAAFEMAEERSWTVDTIDLHTNFDVIESGGDEEGTAVFVDAWRGLTFEVDAATGLVTTLVVVSAAEA